MVWKVQTSSGVDVPGANVTARSLRGLLLKLRAREEQVLVHRARRGHAVAAARELVRHAALQVDLAVIAERRIQLARLRVQREQETVHGADDDQRRQRLIA